ncbi:hypothetical protein NOK12_22460 [Nocardioides sp. OK12]|uniref:MarR family winged helix-turn-helix transcriptional regulator n=1 Tax=Nocardioides sp. OK12 TaxID=2758661 RepID=UPI0021C492FD|nr:MarR family transcriptional regulator [Nocardioides sp. OK12]GHJ59728.1 hypothetical protein NOK12_22460 [Nocardioides sp. OK12]
MTSTTAQESDDERVLADVAARIAAIARELLGPHFPHEAVPLTRNEVAVLRHVEQHPGATAGEVARATGLQRSNLSTVVRGLEEKQFLRRSTGSDARTVHLRATEVAAASTAAVRRRWAQVVGAALDPGTDDVEALAASLERLERGLVRLRS